VNVMRWEQWGGTAE